MLLLEKPSRIQLNKILLVTKYPPWADVAVPYTLGLARDHGAHTHVVHPMAAHTSRNLTQVPQGGAFRESWRDLVFEVAARQIAVDNDFMAARLREMTDRHDFDLIVISLGHAEASSDRVLGNTLEHVLNSGDCPVMVVGPAVDRGVPPRTEPATILHATDFSPHALAAAQHAFSWAQEYQSWITVLHVVDGVGAWTESERKRLETPFRAWMEELVPEELPVWCEVDHRIEFGRPAEKIVRAAEELHADLIVIGLTGMDAVRQDNPGATALEVIRRAPSPVLVVRDYTKKRTARPVTRDRRAERLAITAA
jgi:nucleotide-binding universal stress UspA family protein